MAQTTPTFNGVVIPVDEIEMNPTLYGTDVRARNGTLHRSLSGVKHTITASCEKLTVAELALVKALPKGTAWPLVDEEGVTYTVMLDTTPYTVNITQGVGVRLYDVTINMVEV